MFAPRPKTDPNSPTKIARDDLIQDCVVSGTVDDFRACLRTLRLNPAEVKQWTLEQRKFIATTLNDYVKAQSNKELQEHEGNKSGYTY